jgi:uncharacterized protein YndB with AHSA1/START domain
MTEQATDTAVRRTVTVEAPIERAFTVFTEGLDAWWPREHHLGQADMKEAVLEPKAGGRWYERSVDGSECSWGQVLAWEPPHRVMLSWQVSGNWEYEPELAKSSEIEVRFTADGPARTTVELEHRLFERHGDGAANMRSAISGDGGWTGTLRRYAAAVAG